MRRELFFVVILAFSGYVLSHEGSKGGIVEREAEDVFERYGGRKLLQEKATKTSKPGKSKGKGDEAVKMTTDAGLEESKPKKVSMGKSGGKSKQKRVLDEEEDEDINFLVEETKGELSNGREDAKKSKKAGKKNEDPSSDVQKVDDGKMVEETMPSAKKSSKALKKNEVPKVDVQIDDIKEEEEKASATKEDKAKTKLRKKETEDGKGTSRKQNKNKKKTPVEEVDPINEETSEPVEVEIIPDDEDDTVDQKVEVKEKAKDVEEDSHGVDTEEEQPKLEKPGKTKKTDAKEKLFKTKAEVKKPDEDVAEENVSETSTSTETSKVSKSADTKTESTKVKDKQKPVNKSKPDATRPKKSNSPKKTTAEAPKKTDVVKGEKKETKKEEQIPIKFSEGAAHDVEDLHTDAGLSKTGGESLGELDEEEDVDFMDEMAKLPSKFQETAGNVADTLRPGFQKLSETSKTYFSSANQQMTESFTPIVGEQVAPVMASLITYALLLMPLFAALYVFERIRATLSLAKVLYFSNLYLVLYFVTLVLATFALHTEPMAFVFRNSRSSSILLQLLQALGYSLYVILYTVLFFKSCSSGTVLDRLASGFQWMIVALFGLHYYVTVFHRAMAMKVPRTTWKVYLVYSSAFAVLALFARAKIEPSKKEYYYTTDDPDEAVPVDKRS